MSNYMQINTNTSNKVNEKSDFMDSQLFTGDNIDYSNASYDFDNFFENYSEMVADETNIINSTNNTNTNKINIDTDTHDPNNEDFDVGHNYDNTDDLVNVNITKNKISFDLNLAADSTSNVGVNDKFDTKLPTKNPIPPSNGFSIDFNNGFNNGFHNGFHNGFKKGFSNGFNAGANYLNKGLNLPNNGTGANSLVGGINVNNHNKNVNIPNNTFKNKFINIPVPISIPNPSNRIDMGSSNRAGSSNGGMNKNIASNGPNDAGKVAHIFNNLGHSSTPSTPGTPVNDVTPKRKRKITVSENNHLYTLDNWDHKHEITNLKNKYPVIDVNIKYADGHNIYSYFTQGLFIKQVMTSLT